MHVLFMGGNGHCAARLAAAIDVLRQHETPPFALHNVEYPGFEGRPRARSLEVFLNQTAAHIESLPTGCIYATGIGGLAFLLMREMGKLIDRPAILQAPVLWGLEQRIMPRVVQRLPFAPQVIRRLFRREAFQRNFAKKHFRREHSPAALSAFFAGYAACDAFEDLFGWLNANILRRLEHADSAQLLHRTHFLWGDRDTIVPLREVMWTERALKASLNVEVIPEWGHYPMLDEPGAWVQKVADVAAATMVR